jgi:hypothetical protein
MRKMRNNRHLLPLIAFLRETVAFILVTCTRVNEINATFEFSSRCLRASVVNLQSSSRFGPFESPYGSELRP